MPKRVPPNPEPDEDRPRLTPSQLREVGRLMQPQFPDTPEGQLARVFKQEALNNLREQRLNEAAERLAAEATRLEALLERVQRAEEFTSTAAAAATRAAVEAIPALLRQLHLFPGADDPVEPDEHCPGGFPDEWVEFRAFFVKYEQGETEDNRTKVKLAGVIGCHPRSITRGMEWQGLDKKRWPPSKWPIQAPPRPIRKRRSVTITDFETSLAAALLFGYGLVDYVVDGRFDHILVILKACGVGLVQP